MREGGREGDHLLCYMLQDRQRLMSQSIEARDGVYQQPHEEAFSQLCPQRLRLQDLLLKEISKNLRRDHR
jgi:hypothetical protein